MGGWVRGWVGGWVGGWCVVVVRGVDWCVITTAVMARDGTAGKVVLLDFSMVVMVMVMVIVLEGCMLGRVVTSWPSILLPSPSAARHLPGQRITIETTNRQISNGPSAWQKVQRSRPLCSTTAAAN